MKFLFLQQKKIIEKQTKNHPLILVRWLVVSLVILVIVVPTTILIIIAGMGSSIGCRICGSVSSRGRIRTIFGMIFRLFFINTVSIRSFINFSFFFHNFSQFLVVIFSFCQLINSITEIF